LFGCALLQVRGQKETEKEKALFHCEGQESHSVKGLVEEWTYCRWNMTEMKELLDPEH